jgi:hypothetical protein
MLPEKKFTLFGVMDKIEKFRRALNDGTIDKATYDKWIDSYYFVLGEDFMNSVVKCVDEAEKSQSK